jgi:CheY-like chemotaxis protein
MTPTPVKRLVLIADDNRETTEMYSLYLRTLGYPVETASDGREAVIKARTLGPAVIVLDLRMPHLDGWAAMRVLRADPKTAAIPIIVLTGHDLKEHLKHSALSEGAWSYLMKPCLPERLAREISERLDTARTQDRTASGL